MTTGPTDEESTTAAGGPGGMPLALRLSEVLCSTAASEEKMGEGKGLNPYFEGLHRGESDELRALRLALVKERDELRADLKKHKGHIRLKNVIITNHCIAMQAALIDQHHKGHEAGMVWIGNTLFGPGLIPDIGEALALSATDPAQAWFDAKTAEHEAMRAKQDAAAVGAA